MSESKHRPAPWDLGGWCETLGYDCMTGGLKVGPVYLDGADYGQKQCQPIQPADKERLMADARLIAAAPDLLEALSGMVAVFAMNNAEPIELRNALLHQIAGARAAIAKAEGRS